jgi:hypothetical protein
MRRLSRLCRVCMLPAAFAPPPAHLLSQITACAPHCLLLPRSFSAQLAVSARPTASTSHRTSSPRLAAASAVAFIIETVKIINGWAWNRRGHRRYIITELKYYISYLCFLCPPAPPCHFENFFSPSLSHVAPRGIECIASLSTNNRSRRVKRSAKCPLSSACWSRMHWYHFHSASIRFPLVRIDSASVHI